MSDLREPVARAMAVMGCGWRETSPGVFAAIIQPSLRHHFRGQAELRVVFDPEVWQQDRRAQLAAPGGGFLDDLERALAERAGQPIRVGGVLESDGALGRAWAARVRVTNAQIEQLDHPISFEQALRFVFEAELPVSPPVTELVAVACDLRGNVLAPMELARRDPVDAYDYDEVAGALSARIEWPESIVQKLRDRCRAEAERRIKLAFAGDLRRRTDQGEARIEEADLAHSLERRVAQTDAEREELDQEFARRRTVYKANASGTIRVQERTVTLLVTGKDSLIARYRRRTGASVKIVPKMSLGRLRDDQCAHCQQVRTEYVIARDSAELWCTSCGRACAAPDCAGTMRADTETCPRCGEVRWCPDHVSACATCSAPRCPDHGGTCAVCGNAGCETHLRKHSESSELLCAAHGLPCAVDGAVLRASELVPCARSGDAVCARHRVTVDLPAGAVIRADRMRVCAASGMTLDVDLAGVCSVDGLLYVASQLVDCPVTHRRLHPRNAVSVEGDELVLHPDGVVRSTVSGAYVARDRALADQFLDGEILHPNEVVRCELSGRWTAQVRTVRATCCGRVVARSLTALHSIALVPLCHEHAARCGVDRAVLRADELRPCNATGVRVCADHGATLDDPVGGFVRRERVRVCTETGDRIDQDAAGTCTVDGATYKRTLLVTCPLSHLSLHPSHGIRPEGDARLLHPSGVVNSDISGKLIARDVAIPDAFSDHDNAFLHPAEAVRCELSSKWTARVRTVVAPCCGKRVAKSLTRVSVLSGRPVCDACARTCAGNHGPFLPDDVRSCDVSGAGWCLTHLISTSCGRHVGPDRAIRLDDGSWECVEHYRRCGPGDHTAPVAGLVTSILTARECCPSHRTRCECHGGVVGYGEYAQDPYDSSAWCPSSMAVCVRCGSRAPKARDADLCRWCAAPVPLDQAEPSFALDYRRLIVPRLGWFTVRMSVHVTGTPTLACFQVGTLTGEQLVFQVTADTVHLLKPLGTSVGR
jgi:hypothetical protein